MRGNEKKYMKTLKRQQKRRRNHMRKKRGKERKTEEENKEEERDEEEEARRTERRFLQLGNSQWTPLSPLNGKPMEISCHLESLGC